MLILSRKRGQSIIINHNVEIIVTAIEGDQVKIGISAPKEMPVFRKEVLEEVKETNRLSLSNSSVVENLKSWVGGTKK
ncbi:carbon storage regulator CsrA [Cohnella terricola]|uniref:Translational regulator CsrA n=1 Tax=Cohnella terricola TaxID=1289167 RepID=A0A559J894_9BACL|nr:carbon storage regulator CsrA [Cohnella terricola]TVX96108.1 carbon storage regulator CsrA [Cohnella terricola]